MRLLFILLCLSCATVPTADGDCPRSMTDAEQRDGYYRCRAECASWGRDVIEYRRDCACVCTPRR